MEITKKYTQDLGFDSKPVEIWLTKSPSFSLRFKEGEDISLSYWSLDVSDDGTGRFVQKFNADLGTLSLRSGTSDNSGHLCKSDSCFIHVYERKVNYIS